LGGYKNTPVDETNSRCNAVNAADTDDTQCWLKTGSPCNTNVRRGCRIASVNRGSRRSRNAERRKADGRRNGRNGRRDGWRNGFL